MSKIGRNDPCPCGSGKKYKKCCVDKFEKQMEDPARRTGELFADGPAPKNRFVEQDGIFKGRWTPMAVEKMANSEIIGQFNELGFGFDAAKFVADAARFADVRSLIDKWRSEYTVRAEYFDEDFFLLGADELWKRLSPDRPSVEMVREWVEEGYLYGDERKEKQKLESWLRAWNGVKGVAERTGCDINDIVDDHFDNMEYDFFEWLGRFELSISEISYAPGCEEIAKRYETLSAEMRRLFPGFEGELSIYDKIAIAIQCFENGEFSEGEKRFERLTKEYPVRAEVYQAWGDVYRDIGGKDGPDYDRALKLYRSGLENKDVYDKGKIYESMRDLNVILKGEEAPGFDEAVSREAVEWLDGFIELSGDEKFGEGLRIIRSGKLPTYNEYVEAEEELCDFIDGLYDFGDPERACEISRELKMKCPGLYTANTGRYNFNNLLYALKIKEENSIRMFLSDECSNHGGEYRYALKMIRAAIFFGFMAPALDACEKLAGVVGNMRFNENEFDPNLNLYQVLNAALLETEYMKIKSGCAFSADILNGLSKMLKITGGSELIAAASRELGKTSPEPPGEGYMKGFRGERIGALEELVFHFFKFMLETKKIDFPTSGSIWYAMTRYFNESRPEKKIVTQPDEFFEFDEKAFKKYLEVFAKENGPDDFPMAAAILWGAQYFYDFMRKYCYIGEKIHKSATKGLAKQKEKFAKKYSKHAWKFGFVNRLENVADESGKMRDDL